MFAWRQSLEVQGNLHALATRSVGDFGGSHVLSCPSLFQCHRYGFVGPQKTATPSTTSAARAIVLLIIYSSLNETSYDLELYRRGTSPVPTENMRIPSPMRKPENLIAFALLTQFVIPGATSPARAQTKAAYPAMAPLDRYLMPDEKSEIALARTAAPASISNGAEIMVLGRAGYTTAAKGSNGFLCIVERAWGAATDQPEFWNPKIRAPICFNPQSARSFAPIYLMKTKLVLAGKSKTEIVQATASALDKKELPALETGAMCYMLSKQQYLNDEGTNWHPHLMFFIPGGAAKSWGADLPGSPVLAADDPEERVTIMMVPIGTWSDGTPAPPMAH